ncbi:MAG: hypothetical protein RIT28_5020 [Pseudomonadota bacterium]
MRRLALLLLAALMVSPAHANPLTLLRALGKLGSGAGKVAKVGAGAKAAAKAGAATKLAVGASAGALAADAARGFAVFGDDVGRTALYVGGGESGALNVISRAGDQAVTSPMALGSALDDAARLGGKPLDLLLDPNAALRVDLGKLPPDTRLFVMTGDGVVRPVTVVDDGVGNIRAVVKDSLEQAWDLGQLVMDMSLNDEGWPAAPPVVIAVTGGDCSPLLADQTPDLFRCDAASVSSWLQAQTERAVILLLGEGDDAEPLVTIAQTLGHDLTALTFGDSEGGASDGGALDEVSVAVATALVATEGARHAPFLKVAPMSSSQFTPGNPAVMRGEFVPGAPLLPSLRAGVWVVHLPEPEAVIDDAEALGEGGAADEEPPLWIYGLGLLLSIPVIALMKAKGKL